MFRESPSLGRRKQRRGEDWEKEILANTLGVLIERGYEGLTIDLVTARSLASKSTIYKRWPGKQELVVSAFKVRRQAQLDSLPDTGSLRTDLIALLEQFWQQGGYEEISVISSLMMAMRHDFRLADLLQAQVSAEALTPFGALCERAVKRGELLANSPIDLIHEICESLLLRQCLLERPFDRSFIIRLVDGVLLPLLEKPFETKLTETRLTGTPGWERI